MPKSYLFICLAMVALAMGWSTVSAAPVPERQKELTHLLKHDCGSCHGMLLAGGLGPALKPGRLRSYTVEQLTTTILHGRPGTPMPPWSPFLSEQDARWLAEHLKLGDIP